MCRILKVSKSGIYERRKKILSKTKAENKEILVLIKEVFKEHKGNYIAIEVKGESMNDGTRAGYIEGDILLCREVPAHHWQSKLHIKKWDFVIVTKTDGILIKKITKHNTTTGDIILHSLNEDYDDINLNLHDVAKIFNVVQVSYKK